MDKLTQLPRVLVVDGEPEHRVTMCRALRTSFDVVTASSLAEAQAALEAFEDLAAVVSEHDIAGDGLEALAAARRRRPDAVRILTSGQAQPDDIEEHLGSGLVARFLRKPWTAAQLVDSIKQCSGAAPEGGPMPAASPSPGPSAAEGELLERARRGDQRALEFLLQGYKPTLTAIMRRGGVAAADVDDLLQLVYAAFSRHLSTVRSAGGFLVTMATNFVRNYRRDEARRREATKRYAQVFRASPSPATAIELRLVGRLDALRALESAGRRCLELIRALVLGDRPYAAYAAETGIPRNTLGPAVSRCLRRMRSFLLRGGYRHRRRGA